MSDSKNTPPSDEWIKSLYHSGSDMPGDKVPEPVDAAILKHANLAHKTGSKKFPLYAWIYGTAASAIFGILLVMQIPAIHEPSQFGEEVKPSKPAISNVPQEAGKRAVFPASAISASAEMEKRLPERSVEKMLVSNEDRIAEPASAMDANSDYSDCAAHLAYFTNKDQQQTLMVCQSSTQLKFKFEENTDPTCKTPYYYVISSPAKVSLAEDDEPNGLQRIIIKHAGDSFSLSCDSGHWKLTRLEQP